MRKFFTNTVFSRQQLRIWSRAENEELWMIQCETDVAMKKKIYCGEKYILDLITRKISSLKHNGYVWKWRGKNQTPDAKLSLTHSILSNHFDAILVLLASLASNLLVNEDYIWLTLTNSWHYLSCQHHSFLFLFIRDSG